MQILSHFTGLNLVGASYILNVKCEQVLKKQTSFLETGYAQTMTRSVYLVPIQPSSNKTCRDGDALIHNAVKQVNLIHNKKNGKHAMKMQVIL